MAFTLPDLPYAHDALASLCMSKETLERRVIANPRIDLYECGERDVRSGQIDRSSTDFLVSRRTAALAPDAGPRYHSDS